MELKVIKPFNWAHDNVRVESFAKDQVINTEDKDLIRVATEEKWVTKVRGGAGSNALTSAPENKALQGADEHIGNDTDQVAGADQSQP